MFSMAEMVLKQQTREENTMKKAKRIPVVVEAVQRANEQLAFWRAVKKTSVPLTYFLGDEVVVVDLNGERPLWLDSESFASHLVTEYKGTANEVIFALYLLEKPFEVVGWEDYLTEECFLDLKEYSRLAAEAALSGELEEESEPKEGE